MKNTTYDRIEKLREAAARLDAAMKENGYYEWTLTNIGRGEAWASQDRGLAPRTRVSKSLEKRALRQARKRRVKNG